jgi:hypothetical protein
MCQRLAPVLGVERAYLETALEAIEAIERDYGSTRDFLIEVAGVPITHLDALLQHILEPVG